jgi:hypothetical protein
MSLEKSNVHGNRSFPSWSPYGCQKNVAFHKLIAAELTKLAHVATFVSSLRVSLLNNHDDFCC